MTSLSPTPQEFVKRKKEVEAVIMHIGLNTTQVILIAEDGEWIRYVVPSLDAAKETCKRLGVEYHEGYPDHLRLRMANYKRSPRDWAEAPYPERFRGSST